MTAILMVLGALVLIPLVITISSIINGYVFSTLWGWFIIPIFGLTALSIPQAIGISMIVSFLTYQFQPSNKQNTKEDDQKDMITRILHLVLYPITVLAVGYIVKGFM